MEGGSLDGSNSVSRPNQTTTTNTDGISEISIAVPWGHINGYSWGNPSGMNVLALHGWLDNSGTFFKLLPHLTRDINMIAIDLPGHGRSSHRPPGSNNHFQEYLTDIQFVLNALGWKQFILLAHSLGAAVASWYAAMFPKRVLRLVLIDNLGEASSSPDRVLEKLSIGLTNLRENVSKVYPTYDTVVKKFWNIYSQKDPSFTLEAARTLCERGVVSVEGGYQFTADERHKQAYLLEVENTINFAFVKNISCPILLFVFKQSYVNKNRIQHSISLLPKELIKVIEMEGGHHAHLYSPEIVASDINLFLSQYSKL